MRTVADSVNTGPEQSPSHQHTYFSIKKCDYCFHYGILICRYVLFGSVNSYSFCKRSRVLQTSRIALFHWLLLFDVHSTWLTVSYTDICYAIKATLWTTLPDKCFGCMCSFIWSFIWCNQAFKQKPLDH